MFEKKGVLIQPQSAKRSQAVKDVPPAVDPLPGHRIPAPASKQALTATHGDVAQRAHDLYMESGCAEGRCDENWLRAEAELREKGAVACQAEHRLKETFAPDAVDAKQSALPT